MNSTATFEIVPFGFHPQSEGEAEGEGEGEIRRRFTVVRRFGSPVGHRFGARVGFPGRIGHRIGAPGFGRRFGPGFIHRAGPVFGPRFGGRFAPGRFGPGRFGLGRFGPARFGHGLFAHRFARDFGHRFGIRRPFGPGLLPFAAGVPFPPGLPTFDPAPVGFPPPPPIFGDPTAAAGAPPPAADAPAPAAVPMAAPTGIAGASSEEQIRWIQFVLNSVLGTSLPTDGVPTADLRNALQTFQQQQGLPVSGFAGPDTIAALQAAASGQGAGGGQAAAPAPQPDAAAAPPAADGGDAQGGEFEIMPAFGGRGSWRMHQRGRFDPRFRG